MATRQFIPRKYRKFSYLFYGLGSVAMTYASTKGVVGAAEVNAWTGCGAVFGLTAYAYTRDTNQVDESVDDGTGPEL